jgi:gamma-tubulin complex component 3
MKSYILLLMSYCCDILFQPSRRANQLFRHNLTGLLDGALRSCNAQFEPPYVLERLGVRLLEPSPGDSGWEVFSLDYAIDPPLAAVIHAEAISKYRIAFHMLWRLKRVEWALSGANYSVFTCNLWGTFINIF